MDETPKEPSLDLKASEIEMPERPFLVVGAQLVWLYNDRV